MSRTSNLFRSGSAFAVALVAFGLLASTASAQTPIPSGNSPTMIGGQVIGAGHFVVGAATGYPETGARLIWGRSAKFDIGLNAGVTYATRSLGGMGMRVGLDLQAPLRFSVVHMPKATMGIRVVPFFRVGQYSPYLGVGGILGFRFNIALPKIFQLIVGAETRAGLGSSGGGNVCSGGFCVNTNRANYFEGATYAVLGLETLLKNKWFINLQFDEGGWYVSGNGGGGGAGMFNAWFGFGAMLH